MNGYRQSTGLLYGLMGATFFSIKAILIKIGFGLGIDPKSLLSMRFIISLPIYLAAAYAFRSPVDHKIRKRDVFAMSFFGGISYYAAAATDFAGLKYVTVGIERMTLYLYPTLVTILGFVLFGRKISRRQVTALLASYLGIGLFFLDLSGVPDDVSGLDLAYGVALIFASSLFYAAYLLSSEVYLARYSIASFTSISMASGIALSLAMQFLQGPGLGFADYDAKGYGVAASLALFSTVLPSFLIAKSTKLVGAAQAAVIGQSGPIITLLLANIFLSETITIVHLIAMVVIVSGVFWFQRVA